MANDASLQLVECAEMIVRDLHFKRHAETLQPIDDAIRHTLETCLRRGIQGGDASPEEREFAARLGISA